MWDFKGEAGHSPVEEREQTGKHIIRVLRGCCSALSRFFYLDPFRQRRGGPEVLSGSFAP